MSTIIKARSPFHIRQQNLVSEPVQVNLSCADIDITGFEINSDGVITVPTAKIREGQTAITIDSTSPASYERSDVSVPRTLYCTFTVPSGYKNTGEEIVCTATAIQESQPVIMQCKTMRVRNFSLTETLTVSYIACGNIESTQFVAVDDSEDICVTPQTDITWSSGSTEFSTFFVSRGCVTGVKAYGVSGYVGPYSSRQLAYNARHQSSWIHNNRGTLAWIDDFYIRDTFGIRKGTLISAGNAEDTNGDGNNDQLTAPYLKDGWYAMIALATNGFVQTDQNIEFRTVDSVVQEGGFTYNDGAILDPL